MLCNAQVPKKTSSSMNVIESGRLILFSFLQFSNADFPICVTELGMLISINELHLKKVLTPIFVTDLGIMISDSESHS